MKNFFRICSLLGFLLASVIFTFVCIGENRIPNQIEILENEEVNVGNIFATDVLQKDMNIFFVEPKKDASSLKSEQFLVDVSLFHTIPVKSASVIVNKRQYVVPSGDVFGVKIYAEGLMVVGMDSVATQQGTICPAKEAGIKIGDVLLSMNGKKVETVKDFSKALMENGERAEIELLRDKKKMKVTLYFAESKTNHKKRAGLWVRDSTAGVGTLTFYDAQTGVFAGLGHAICDSDTGKCMPFKSGKAVTTKIKGCYKGAPGVTGELCGVFQNTVMGTLYGNCSNGVYGMLYKWNKTEQEIPVATRQEVKEGSAQIISTVDETGPHYYDVEIKKVMDSSENDGKNLILEITDSRLISKTGGIVQGMSGSPILQNGMLVGAVTHVFVNNALEGYGVFAETMLKQANEFQKDLPQKAS